jgi:signal peptidase
MERDTQRRAVCCELVDEVARASGEVRLKVNGASMLPALWPGDLITVQYCGLAELRRGQIVLHRQEGKLTAHRIQRISPNHLITRGDSVPACDPPVGADGVVGRVASILRNGRAIQPEWSFRNRAVSSILRRSDFCTRIASRIVLILTAPGSRARRSEEIPAS